MAKLVVRCGKSGDFARELFRVEKKWALTLLLSKNLKQPPFYSLERRLTRFRCVIANFQGV
jgi:hypothetical protein